MNYNKIILAGNLTRVPQLSYTPSQTPVVDFGMVINRKWKGADGQSGEETCFVSCVAFGKPAETINQYFSKGKPILVEGRLKFEQWEQDGQKHSRFKVFVERFTFVGEAKAPAPAPQPQQSPPPPDASGEGEDIPF